MAKSEKGTHFEQFKRYMAVIWKVADVDKLDTKIKETYYIFQTMQGKMYWWLGDIEDLVEFYYSKTTVLIKTML